MAVYFSNPDNRSRGKVETLAAARTLTAADSGIEFLLDAAGGAAISLPALSTIPDNQVVEYTFTVAAAFADTNWVISSSEGTNINGGIADMGSTVAGVVAASEDYVNFVASAETIGDTVTLKSDKGNSQWLVNGVCFANGGITVTAD